MPSFATKLDVSMALKRLILVLVAQLLHHLKLHGASGFLDGQTAVVLPCPKSHGIVQIVPQVEFLPNSAKVNPFDMNIHSRKIGIRLQRLERGWEYSHCPPLWPTSSKPILAVSRIKSNRPVVNNKQYQSSHILS